MLLMSTFMYLYVCLLIHSYIHEEIVHMKRPPLLPQDLSFFSKKVYVSLPTTYHFYSSKYNKSTTNLSLLLLWQAKYTVFLSSS